MPKAARIGDIASAHGCFPPTPIIAGSGDVFINGIPAARLGDAAAPHGCDRIAGCHCWVVKVVNSKGNTEK